MTSSSSVPDITVQAPSRSQSQTPQATPLVSHRAFLSAEDAAHRPISPTVSTTVLASPSSPTIPLVPQDSTNPAGGTPKIIALPDGQLPLGFVPQSVSSPSQSLPTRTTPVSAHAPLIGPPSGVVANPKLPTQTGPRSLYSVPVPDSSSSSGRHSLYQPVRIPLTSTMADSSVMVPPPSIFSQPPEPSSSETTEDDAVASSIASSNDSLTTPPPSRKKAKAKAKRPTYDAAPTPPGQEYPTTPLMRGATLASGPSTTSTGRGRGGSAGMTPAARTRSLRH